MISKKMENMVANSSAIRAMFEEGNRLAKIYGAENVFDFSLGNPNVPAPEAVKKAIIDLLNEEDPVVNPFLWLPDFVFFLESKVGVCYNSLCTKAYTKENLR